MLEELKDKSDSESFDDEKEKLLNVKKAMQLDKLKEEVKNLELELKQLKFDNDANISRLQSNLNSQKIANQNLKNDYDSLQEKFDKNNIIGYDLFSQTEENLGKVSTVIKIKNNNLIQLYINDKEVLLPYNEKNILVLTF